MSVLLQETHCLLTVSANWLLGQKSHLNVSKFRKPVWHERQLSASVQVKQGKTQARHDKVRLSEKVPFGQVAVHRVPFRYVCVPEITFTQLRQVVALVQVRQ